MKRLFTIIAFCAATAISAGALSNPAAADGGRHDSRHQAQTLDRHQGNHYAGNRHRKTFQNAHRHDFGRRDRMSRRYHKRHRHGHGYGRGHGYRQDYRHRSPRSYGTPRAYGYGHGLSYLMGGSRIVIRFD